MGEEEGAALVGGLLGLMFVLGMMNLLVDLVSGGVEGGSYSVGLGSALVMHDGLVGFLRGHGRGLLGLLGGGFSGVVGAIHVAFWVVGGGCVLDLSQLGNDLERRASAGSREA